MTMTNSSSCFGSVLREVRKNRDLSQEQLAEASDLDRTYISMLERGVKNPTLQTLFQICKSLDIPADYLIGRMILLSKTTSKTTSKITSKNVPSPVVGSTVAFAKVGSLDLNIDQLLMLKDPTGTFFIKALGDSMALTIKDGDYLIVDRTMIPKNGQMILAKMEEDFYLKRYHKELKVITLRCDNPLFKSIEVNKKSCFSIAGVVVSTFRLDP